MKCQLLLFSSPKSSARVEKEPVRGESRRLWWTLCWAVTGDGAARLNTPALLSFTLCGSLIAPPPTVPYSSPPWAAICWGLFRLGQWDTAVPSNVWTRPIKKKEKNVSSRRRRNGEGKHLMVFSAGSPMKVWAYIASSMTDEAEIKIWF